MGGWVTQLCGCFPPSAPDLREVGAPRWVVGQARPEERPGVGEQRLAGTVGFIRQWIHQPVLGRSSVRSHAAELLLSRFLFSPALMSSVLVSQERQMSPGISQCHHLRNDHSYYMYVFYMFWATSSLLLYLYVLWLNI